MQVAHDVTSDELEFQAALIASLQLTPIATVLTNPRLDDNPIIGANAAFCALTGYELAEVMGRNCRFLSVGGTGRSSSNVLREGVSSGRAVLAELVNYRKDGSSFRNSIMIAPIFNADRTIAYFIGSQMEVRAQPALAVSKSAVRASQLVMDLTRRQKQVLGHMMGGLLNRQIALSLGIRETTVKMHRRDLLSRLQAATTADAIRIGLEARLQAPGSENVAQGS